MKKIIGTLLLSGAICAVSNAAEITWTTASITDLNDVVNTGTTVEAFNGVGDGVTTSPTVNGVTFAAESTLLGLSWTGDPWGTAMTDPAYDSLLSSVDYELNGTGPLALYTFTGLTVNQDYLFQYWHADDGAIGAGRTMTVVLGADTQSGANVLAGNQFATGIFTADATSIDIVVTSSHKGIRMNAMQLRAIPEPATLGLVGLFGGGILFIRRFRKI